MAIDSSFTPLTGAAPGAIPPQNMFPGGGSGNTLGASLGALVGALGGSSAPQPTQVMFGGEMTRGNQGGASQSPIVTAAPDAAQQTGAQEMQTTPAGQAEGQQGSGMDWGTLAQMLVGTGATIAGKPQILALMQYLTQLQKQAGGDEKEKPQGTNSEGTTKTPVSGQTTTQTQDPVASQEGSAPAEGGDTSAQKGPNGGGQQSEKSVPAQGVPAGMEQTPGWVGGNLQEELAKAQALLQIFAPQQIPSFQQSPLPNNAQVFNQGQA